MRLIERAGPALRFTWRIFVRHRWTVVVVVSLVASLFMLGIVGCASTKVSPAENGSNVAQTVDPPIDIEFEQVGGVPPDWDKIVEALKSDTTKNKGAK